MDHWMVRATIHRHNLCILLAHLPRPRSKDVLLEFLANFDAQRRQMYIRGRFNQITPSLVASVLQCGNVRSSDDHTCKDWIIKVLNQGNHL